MTRTSPHLERRLEQVLRVLEGAERPVTMEQIALLLGLRNRSSVQPYLSELEARGAVVRVEGWLLTTTERSVRAGLAGHGGNGGTTPRQPGVVAGETVWRVHAIPGHPELNLTLAVETTAPDVVQVIEAAASRAGVEMERQP